MDNGEETESDGCRPLSVRRLPTTLCQTAADHSLPSAVTGVTHATLLQVGLKAIWQFKFSRPPDNCEVSNRWQSSDVDFSSSRHQRSCSTWVDLQSEWRRATAVTSGPRHAKPVNGSDRIKPGWQLLTRQPRCARLTPKGAHSALMDWSMWHTHRPYYHPPQWIRYIESMLF